MSFEATMNKAVEDFKAKFAGQHREAMKHEFSQTYNELTELGIRAAEKVAMIKDSHKSLNDAEKALGMELTELPALHTALDGYAVVVGHAAKVEPTTPAQAVKANDPEQALKNVKKAHRNYVNTFNGSYTLATSIRVRRDLAEALQDGNSVGIKWAELNRACGRSGSWACTFMRNARKSQVI